MKKLSFAVALLGALAFASPALAADATASTLSINADGLFTAKNLTVIQISGSAIYCRATWGDAFVRLTVLVNQQGSSTPIVKNHGQAGTLGDIQVGDVLDADGRLALSSDSLNINAAHVTDHSLQVEQKTFSGTVQGVNGPAGTFIVAAKGYGNVSISMAATSAITKGARTITVADLHPGDKVLSMGGNFNYTAGTLVADSVSIYQDPSVFVPRNFQGTLKSMNGSTLVVSVSSNDYTVNLAAGSLILSKNKDTAALSRFQVGDTVRFYGAIRKTDLSQIDANTLRDLNF